MTRPSLHRAAFLRRQRRHNRTRPLPLRVRVVNAMSVSTGPVHAAAIFEAALKHDPPADVLLVSEGADFRAAPIARQHGYTSVQPGRLGSPESGAFIAVGPRCTLGPTQVIRGSKATSEGGGIRERSIVKAMVVIDAGTPNLWSHHFASGHAPPPRAPRARARFMRRLAVVTGTRGGDMNLTARMVARVLRGAQVGGVGVLCLAVPGWVPVSKARAIPAEHLADADHPGADFTIWQSKEHQ